MTNEEYTLKVMDVTGRMIYNETMQLPKGRNIHPISLAPEIKGVLFIQLKSKNGVMKVFSIAK